MFSLTGLSPSPVSLPRLFSYASIRCGLYLCVPLPRFIIGLGFSRSIASTWESRLISSPPGTEMFHFPGIALTRMGLLPCRLPHSGIGIYARVQLLRAFRSLPRPFATCHLGILCMPFLPSPFKPMHFSMTCPIGGDKGIRTLAPCLQSRCSPAKLCPHPWWAQEESNFRPHAYQACALTF